MRMLGQGLFSYKVFSNRILLSIGSVTFAQKSNVGLKQEPQAFIEAPFSATWRKEALKMQGVRGAALCASNVRVKKLNYIVEQSWKASV